MLAKRLSRRAAGPAIDALMLAGTITPEEAEVLRGGGAMLLALGDGEEARAALKAGAKAAMKRGRPMADTEVVRRAEELVASGATSLRAAAAEIGIPRSTLSDRLGLGGRPGRPPRLGPEAVVEARRLLSEPGARYPQVAATLAVSEPTLRRALKKADAER